MGGMIAQTLAARAPGPGAVAHVDHVDDRQHGASVSRNRRPIAALITPMPADRAGYIDAASNAFSIIGSPAYPPDEERLRALIGASYDRSYNPIGFLRQLAGILASGDRTEALRSIKAPTVVIHGEDDPLIVAVGRRGDRRGDSRREAREDPRHGTRPAARAVAAVHRRDRREHRACGRRRSRARRLIAHLDMDAFFVAVELRRRPELRGRPVVVATGTDPTARGVVMAASYEARKFGVHSALPLATAHRRCPQMVLLPRDMEHYLEWSRRVMAIAARGDPRRVEVVGLDEAYLDLAESEFPKCECRRVKHRIKRGDGAGVLDRAGAEQAAREDRLGPGQAGRVRVLTPEGMLEAVGDRPASLLPGVGPKTFERLRRAGIETVADLGERDGRSAGARAAGRGAARPRARDRQPRACRRSASASPRAARRRSPRTCPTATCCWRRSTAWRRGCAKGCRGAATAAAR